MVHGSHNILLASGVARELSLTARTLSGNEAKAIGLISRTFATRDALMAGVREVAVGIAAKSPLAVMGTKRVLLYQRWDPLFYDAHCISILFAFQ